MGFSIQNKAIYNIEVDYVSPSLGTNLKACMRGAFDAEKIKKERKIFFFKSSRNPPELSATNLLLPLYTFFFS